MDREPLKCFIHFFVAIGERWNGGQVLSGLWILLMVDNLHLKGVLHDFLGFEAVSHVI